MAYATHPPQDPSGGSLCVPSLFVELKALEKQHFQDLPSTTTVATGGLRVGWKPLAFQGACSVAHQALVEHGAGTLRLLGLSQDQPSPPRARSHSCLTINAQPPSPNGWAGCSGHWQFKYFDPLSPLARRACACSRGIPKQSVQRYQRHP